MAVIQGVRSTENISQDARKFDHSDKLWYVSADYAVLAFFARKLKKVKVMDPEYRWFEKESPLVKMQSITLPVIRLVPLKLLLMTEQNSVPAM